MLTEKKLACSLIIEFISIILIAGLASAQTMTVCPSGCNFTSVQGAINSANNLDTIILVSGGYSEKLTIDKPITIQAQDGFLSGDGSGNATTIASGNVTILNLNITNYGNGIITAGKGNFTNIQIINSSIQNISQNAIYLGYFSEFFDFSGLVLSGNKVSNAKSGIVLQSIKFSDQVSSISVKNNEIFSSQNCIWIDSSSSINIQDNILRNCINGINITSYSDGISEGIITISRNNIHDNYFGIVNLLTQEIKAENNFWGDFSGPNASENPSGKGNKVSSGVKFKPFYIDRIFLSLSSDAQILLGANITLNESSTEILITANNSASNISVPITVSNATLNFAPLIMQENNLRNATLGGEIFVLSNTSKGWILITLQTNTTLISTINWSGIINLPRVKPSSNISVSPDHGKQITAISDVIEIGSDELKILLDRAARIVLSGEAGKDLGYYRANQFSTIKTVCVNDSIEAGNSLSVEGSCRFNNGIDLVIWTKHFTRFVTYTQEDLPQNSDSPSSSGSVGDGDRTYYCQSNWTCTDWTECSENGIHTRICTDSKKCKSTKAPEQVKTCSFTKTSSENETITESNSSQSNNSVSTAEDTKSSNQENLNSQVSAENQKEKSNLITYAVVILSAVILGLMGYRQISKPRLPSQYYAKASKLHKKAEQLYRHGNTIKAEFLYKKAQILRERAENHGMV